MIGKDGNWAGNIMCFLDIIQTRLYIEATDHQDHSFQGRFELEKKRAKMVLLEKLWDDVVAGPQPDRGLGKLRKLTTKPLTVKTEEGESSKYQRSMTMPASPGTPATPVTPTTPTSARKDNVWRSVFHPGSNLATKGIGSEYFDKPTKKDNPTVYDWLYSGETRTKHHH